METKFDVLNFLNKLEVAFYLTSEDHENLIQVKEVSTNLFQNVNSEKLESVLDNVKIIDISSRAGDWREFLDIVKILCEDVRGLYKEYKIKNIKNEI